MLVHLRVLVVDDDSEKRKTVIEALNDELLPYRCNFCEAKDYESALHLLKNDFFDVVILDLLLPAAGQLPSVETSKALIEQMIDGALSPCGTVLGLTAFSEAFDALSEFCDENLLSLVLFEEGNRKWAGRIAGKIRYLVNSKQSLNNFLMKNYDFDVVILVARHDSEFEPITREINWVGPTQNDHPLWPGHQVRIGTMVLEPELSLRTVVFCMSDMGMACTAAIVTQLTSVFRPRIVAVLGMCCGFRQDQPGWQAALGDVLIATESACWDEGKYINVGEGGDYQHRAKTIVIDGAFRDLLRDVVERSAETFTPTLSRYCRRKMVQESMRKYGEFVRDCPDVKRGLIVSGSSVVADDEKISLIRGRHSTAIGLEMEIYGAFVAREAAVGAKPSVLAMKGVADFGDGTKEGGYFDAAQKFASTISFLVFSRIISETWEAVRNRQNL